MFKNTLVYQNKEDLFTISHVDGPLSGLRISKFFDGLTKSLTDLVEDKSVRYLLIS